MWWILHNDLCFLRPLLFTVHSCVQQNVCLKASHKRSVSNSVFYFIYVFYIFIYIFYILSNIYTTWYSKVSKYIPGWKQKKVLKYCSLGAVTMYRKRQSKYCRQTNKKSVIENHEEPGLWCRNTELMQPKVKQLF